MTAPTADMCQPQPREQAVTCWCGRETWNPTALCARHNHEFSQAPASLGGDRHPAAGPPDRHGSAAVPVTFADDSTSAGGHATASVPANSSTPPPASTPGAADASAAAHDHAWPRTARPIGGTATSDGVGRHPRNP